VLDDWHTAPVSEQLRAMLGFLEKVTLTPSDVTPEDVIPLRTLGINDQAIEDALVVCALFNIIDRMADSLNVEIPSPEVFAYTGEMLLLHGYI
jgi:alkylhydroperoxidase family enzyme